MINMIRSGILLLAMSLAFSASAESFKLRYGDAEYWGKQTLQLKQALRQQHGVDPRRYIINRVDVVAKSQQGGGEIWLQTTYNTSEKHIVPGALNSFRNPSDWTFTTTKFGGYGRDPGGDWSLHLNGVFKLREIRIEATPVARSGEAQVRTDSSGRQRAILNMRNLYLSGDSVINLRQEIRSKSRINPDQYHLLGMEVVAKSQYGNATVWLTAGQSPATKQGIVGNPASFGRDDVGSYTRKYFRAGQDNADQPWLLHFNGNVKVDELIVNLAPR